MDCTNKSASKWVSYNPLNDPFLKYIVPCPCNYFLVRKCANKRLVFTVTEENEITLESKGGREGRKGSWGREGQKRAGSEVSLGKIVRNGRR